MSEPEAPADRALGPRVLHIGPAPPPVDGGIAAYLDGLLRSPLAARFQLVVVNTRVPAALQERRWLRGLATPRLLARLRSSIRAGAELVHVHTSAGTSFWEKSTLAGLATRHRVPVLFHLHDGNFERFLKQLRQPARKLAVRILSSSSGVIIPCAAWRPLLEDFVAPQRLVVLPNGVDTDYFDVQGVRRGDATVRFLFVGTLSDAKGLPELRGALQELIQSGCRNLHLDIVGSGRSAEVRRQRESFRRAGLADWVRFHGQRDGDAKRALLRQADVFVLPSRCESFGMANLEAMACGLPVVSTRTGAIPEYLADGEEGFLVQPGDANRLAAVLHKLVQDPALRAQLGARARRRALSYDWTRIGERLAAVYARCLAGEPVAGC